MEALVENAPGELAILDETGHARMQWDKNNPQQVAAARARFDELKAKGYLAYTVGTTGSQGTVIDTFDPNAERIIMSQRMVGG